MEDLKQTPPASIESDAASEYMRGYSDGLAQAEETIAAAIQQAKAEERAACIKIASAARKEAEELKEKSHSDEMIEFCRGSLMLAAVIEFRMKFAHEISN